MNIGPLKDNLVADTDFYKYSHWNLINKGLSKSYTYGEARAGGRYEKTLFAGLHYIIQRHLLSPVTHADVDMAVSLSKAAFGHNAVNEEVWRKVADLGHLPIEIKSVPEGTAVPLGNVLFTVESTEEWFAKSANLLETTLMRVWYPSSILTRSANIKKKLVPIFRKAGTPEILDHLVVDFGLRGASSMESGEIGGMAHLMAFLGTDNARAVRALWAYYGADNSTISENNPLGFRSSTIVASEHSVALSYGRLGEKEYLKRMLLAHGDAPFSVVIDTYDAHGFVRNNAGDEELKQLIIERDARVVFRPDSGEPKIIVLQILELLGEIFGTTRNDKPGMGYKVINYNVGMIQGDGMNEDSIPELYEHIVEHGWSTDNLAVGSGGGLLQADITRDTQRFAIKPSHGIIDGVEFNFMKNPTTDPTKASKSGRLKLHPSYNGNFMTISSANHSKVSFDGFVDALETIYLNGKYEQPNLEQIVKRVNDYVYS